MHYIHYKRIQTLKSLFWKPEGTICIIHHMLAHVLKRMPVECWPTVRTNHPCLTCRNTQSTSPSHLHSGGLMEFWKIFWACFVHLQNCVVLLRWVFCKDYGNRIRKNLFPQWCPLRNREQEQKQLLGLVAPRGRRRPKFWDAVAHRRACMLEFWIKFSRVSSTQKTCFQTQKCWRCDKFKFTFWESNIWQMYVSCMSWCMWCVWGVLTGRSQWR